MKTSAFNSKILGAALVFITTFAVGFSSKASAGSDPDGMVSFSCQMAFNQGINIDLDLCSNNGRIVNRPKVYHVPGRYKMQTKLGLTLLTKNVISTCIFEFGADGRDRLVSCNTPLVMQRISEEAAAQQVLNQIEN